MKSRHQRIRNNQKQRRLCRLETLETRRVMDVAGLVSFSGIYAQDDQAVVEQSGETKIDVVANDLTGGYWGYYYNQESLPERADVIDSLVVESASDGTVEITEDGNVLYKPNEGFTGIDRFNYSIDHDGQTHSASVYVHVVNPVFALRDWFAVDAESENNLLDVLGNDIHSLYQSNQNDDADGESASEDGSQVDTWIASVDAGDLNGTVEISADQTMVIFTPGDDAVGEQSFTYVLEDSNGHQSEATVYVEVSSDSSNASTSMRQNEQRLLEGLVEQYVSDFVKSSGRTYDFWDGDSPWIDVIVFDRIGSTSFLNTAVSLDAGVASRSAVVTGGITTETTNFSGTNNQESSVDEADVVKTDGDYLYSVSNWTTDNGGQQHQLVITDVRDRSNMAVVGRYGLDGPVENLFLNGDRVVVLSQNGDDVEVTVINVADRTSPSLDYESQWFGDLTKASMVGDQIYVVAQTLDGSNLPTLEKVCYQDHVGCFYETASQFVERAEQQIQDVLNAEVTTTTADATTQVDTLGAISFAGDALLDNAVGSAVVSFDIQSDQTGPVDAVSVLHGSGADVYVSPESIFFFSSQYNYRQDTATSDLLTKTSDNFATTRWEQTTRIDQIQFNDAGELQFAASGAVPGKALNSFSFSEHDGYLRITTELNRTNSLYVLAQNGEQLELVGSVDDLAPGERIYSVRFDGDRGFVVTFRKVDPLFVFDLSDPTEPTLLGELKVTGYSNYLQVLDENHVMGIGREANENGLFQEMQISIFDISDLENPQLKHRYSFEGGRDLWSPLMQDAWNLGSHQSVNYFASHQTLVMPVYEGNGSWWFWNGSAQQRDVSMRVLDIDLETGISELGNVDFAEPVDPNKVRAVRIGDDLLSIAPGIVKANVLRSPDQLLGQLLIGAGATDDVFVVRGDTPAMIDVFANDSMTDEQQSEVDIVQPDEGGTVKISGDGELEFTPEAEFIGTAQFSYTVDNVTANVTVEVKPQWHNHALSMDVDGDNEVFARDLLRIVNILTEHGSGDLEKFDQLVSSGEMSASNADVNQDGWITAQDLLQVINYMVSEKAAQQSDSLTDDSPNQSSTAKEHQTTDAAIGQLF